MSALYIHIPFCVSKCDYCDFFSVPCKMGKIPESYVLALCAELEWRFKNFNSEKIETVFIGGGTPSLLSEEDFKKIFTVLKNQGFAENPEITVELNPADITQNLLKTLENVGVNRISVGIQSLNDDVLKFVNRRSRASDIFTALDLIKNNWNGIFSADLISGLPFQTEESFISDLKFLLAQNITHISVYSLVVEDETPLGKKINSGKIDYNFDFADKIWLKAKSFLEKNGFIQYEVSNFYKKNGGSPCRHNLFYWNLKDYIGAGSGGTGSVFGKNGFRYTNTKNIAEYINFWSNPENHLKINPDLSYLEKNISLPVEFENLSLKNQIFESFMMGLRKTNGLSLTDLQNRFDFKISRELNELFFKWEQKNLARKKIVNGEEYFFLTKKGLLFENRFLEELLDIL